LVSSFSVFVNAKNLDGLDPDSIYPNSEGQLSNVEESPLLLKEGRDRFLKSFLAGFEISAPQNLIKNIVALTDGYTINQFTEILIDIICSLREDILDQSICSEVLKKAINKFDPDQIKQKKLACLDEIIYQSEQSPKFRWILKEDLDSTDDDDIKIILDENGRDELIKSLFSNFEISDPTRLIEDIVELTDGYSVDQIVGIITDLIRLSSGKNELDPYACASKLEKAINMFDSGYIQEQKIKKVEKLFRQSLLPPIPFSFDLFQPEPEKKLLDEYTNKGFNEEEENIDFKFPTEYERLNLIIEVLLEHNKSASELFIKKMLIHTANVEISVLQRALTAMAKESQTGSLDQDRYLKYPTNNERRNLIKEILLLNNKFAPVGLIEEIVTLTNYDIPTTTKLVENIVKKSKADCLEQDNCREILIKASDLLDTKEIKEHKLKEIEYWDYLDKLKRFYTSS